MRVLHVDPERGWGGGEVQVMGLVRGLAVRGHASTLAAAPEGRLAGAAADVGVPVLALPIRSHVDIRAGLALRRLVRGHDVVHFHTARAHALAPFCRNRGARLVVTRRMDYVPRGGPYARFLYNRAVDVVIAISNGVRRALLTAGVQAARIRIVPSGIDPEGLRAEAGARERLRTTWRIPVEATLVVMLGALEERKGHRVLLDAASRLAPGHPDLRYVFCGSGSEHTALAAAAAPFGNRVQLVGFRRDVAACLAAADIVAVPSLHEGLGVAALEAMAAGRPVVASAVGGLAEVIDSAVTGLLVPPDDPMALAAALARLAGDPALRRRLGAAARATIDARYTAEKMAAGTLACYEEVRGSD